MDYRDEVFLSVVENLSFSKAAKELFISQPAVTKHIKELENRLNVTLFERKGNRIYLTPAGRLTYDMLKNIKERYRELDFNLGKLAGSFKGTLRIGASSTIAQYLIPRVMAAFYKNYPDINLYLFNGNSFEMEQKLLNHEIDMALVENFSSHPDLKYTDFLTDEIVVVTGMGGLYSRKKNLKISDLLEAPAVLREKGSGTLEVVAHELQKHNVTPEKMNVVMRLGSTESIKSFLSDFDGIALLSEKSIEKELALKILAKVHVNGLTIRRKFRIVFRKGHASQIPQRFADFLFHYNL